MTLSNQSGYLLQHPHLEIASVRRHSDNGPSECGDLTCVLIIAGATGYVCTMGGVTGVTVCDRGGVSGRVCVTVSMRV